MRSSSPSPSSLLKLLLHLALAATPEPAPAPAPEEIFLYFNFFVLFLPYNIHFVGTRFTLLFLKSAPFLSVLRPVYTGDFCRGNSVQFLSR